MAVTFPNESPDYRAARDALTRAEVALRNQIEAVAAQRRALPPGGALAEDYLFHDLAGRAAPLTSLFGPHDTLAIYSLMYRASAEAPCPMCCAMLDSLEGQTRHITQRSAFAVVAASPPARLKALAHSRGWSTLPIYSTEGTGYQKHYNAETEDGAQLPIMNVFRRKGAEVTHFWASESFFADIDGHPRHMDLLWPMWNLFDMTPEGRGDMFPALDYET